MRYALAWFQSDVKHSGQLAIKMMPGGQYTVNYGCRAGAAEVTVWAYAPVAGKMTMRVVDPNTMETAGEDVTTTTEAWEQLKVNFTAQKKAYFIYLVHSGVSDPSLASQYGYFDDLV